MSAFSLLLKHERTNLGHRRIEAIGPTLSIRDGRSYGESCTVSLAERPSDIRRLATPKGMCGAQNGSTM